LLYATFFAAPAAAESGAIGRVDRR